MDKEKAHALLGALVSTRSAASGGLTQERQLRQGELVELSSRFALPRELYSALEPYEQKWITVAAVAAGAPRAVLCGRSAARLLGMWVVPPAEEKVELMLPSGGLPPKSKWAPGVVYYRDGFLADTFAEAHGLHMTTYLRTAFDIAARHGFLEGLVAVDWLLGHGVVTRNQLQLEVQRMRGRKGVGSVREVVRHAIDCSESPYESYARGLLIEAGLEVRAQVQIGNFRVDLLVGRVIVEVDGRGKYDGVTYKPLDETLRSERERENQLQDRGYLVRRVSPQELRRDPQGFVERIRRALAVS
ncbi:endonuclease domain-containing protein [uncultured Corynebacterium sp.]|uniref:endonuclease domain-containing protein n=1 Tax=uncultured Corynebacterium sp. TaxID=159447 RepID=UPI002609F507|nr:DUF559 domain-containing protein [uncultured Corynebacterium sp.]